MLWQTMPVMLDDTAVLIFEYCSLIIFKFGTQKACSESLSWIQKSVSYNERLVYLPHHSMLFLKGTHFGDKICKERKMFPAKHKIGKVIPDRAPLTFFRSNL